MIASKMTVFIVSPWVETPPTPAKIELSCIYTARVTYADYVMIIIFLFVFSVIASVSTLVNWGDYDLNVFFYFFMIFN